MRLIVAAAMVAALVMGCASHTGVVPMGSNAYMIAKQQATGFPGLGNMKTEVLGEGSAYCASKGRQFELLSSNETQPPYVLGNYPRVEIHFACRDISTSAVPAGGSRAQPNSAPRTTTTGSGAFVSQDGLVLTAEHVIRGGKTIEVVTYDGRRVSARVKSSSRGLDLAVLVTDLAPPAFLPVRLVKPTLGARVFTIGYPLPGVLGQEPKVSDGVINANTGISDDASFMQISIPVQPGNSGGPVVTEQGILVGVVSSSAAVAPFIERTGTLPQNVNWAVHTSLAVTLLGREGPQPATRTRDEAIADALRASVLIVVRGE